MSITRQFSKGVAWMAAGNWLEQAINFIVFVVLARLLGAEAFGLLAMATAFVILSEFLVRETLSEFLIAIPDPEDAHFNAVFWSLAGLGGVLAALLLIFAGPIAAFYGAGQVRGLIAALSPTVVMIALTAVPVALLRRELQFKTLSLRAISGVFVGGVVGIGMAAAGFGVWSLAGQRLAQVATNILMAWGAVRWRPGLSTSQRHLREVIGFGGQVLGLRAAELALAQSPSVIIGATLGPAALGLFSIAWRLVEIASFLIVTPLRMAAQPAFAAMTRQGARAADLLIDISRLSGLAAFPAFAGLAVLAEPVLHLFFGAKWMPAAPALSVLALVGLYFCIEKVQQSFCLAAGRAGAITALAWAEVILGAALIWIATRWGLVAVAAAFVVPRYLLWIFRFRVVASIGGLRVGDLVSCHLRPAFAALVMAAGVLAVARATEGFAPAIPLAAGFVTGVLLFAGLTFLLMPDRVALLKTYVGNPRENSAKQG